MHQGESRLDLRRGRSVGQTCGGWALTSARRCEVLRKIKSQERERETERAHQIDVGAHSYMGVGGHPFIQVKWRLPSCLLTHLTLGEQMRQSVSHGCDLNDEEAQLCHSIICPTNLHLTECPSAVNTMQRQKLLLRSTKAYDSSVNVPHLCFIFPLFTTY